MEKSTYDDIYKYIKQCLYDKDGCRIKFNSDALGRDELLKKNLLILDYIEDSQHEKLIIDDIIDVLDSVLENLNLPNLKKFLNVYTVLPFAIKAYDRALEFLSDN